MVILGKILKQRRNLAHVQRRRVEFSVERFQVTCNRIAIGESYRGDLLPGTLRRRDSVCYESRKLLTIHRDDGNNTVCRDRFRLKG